MVSQEATYARDLKEATIQSQPPKSINGMNIITVVSGAMIAYWIIFLLFWCHKNLMVEPSRNTAVNFDAIDNPRVAEELYHFRVKNKSIESSKKNTSIEL